MAITATLDALADGAAARIAATCGPAGTGDVTGETGEGPAEEGGEEPRGSVAPRGEG